MSQAEKRILCVDDDVDSCKFLKFMLSSASEDYLVKSAYTPDDAIELIEEEPFDLYILDNWMFGFSGVQLCSRIRYTDKQTPILFFTAAVNPRHREEAINAGANEYLIKPDDLGRIEDTVRNLLH